MSHLLEGLSNVAAFKGFLIDNRDPRSAKLLDDAEQGLSCRSVTRDCPVQERERPALVSKSVCRPCGCHQGLLHCLKRNGRGDARGSEGTASGNEGLSRRGKVVLQLTVLNIATWLAVSGGLFGIIPTMLLSPAAVPRAAATDEASLLPPPS